MYMEVIPLVTDISVFLSLYSPTQHTFSYLKANGIDSILSKSGLVTVNGGVLKIIPFVHLCHLDMNR